MDEAGFYPRLRRAWASDRYLCVGLDPDDSRVPAALSGSAESRAVAFCLAIAEATAPFCSAFKVNSAYFEALGLGGMRALEVVIGHLKEDYPGCVVILDAKRGDVDHTNDYYATAAFDVMGADVITVHPYIGRESLLPFLRRLDRGVIVMGANSSLGAGEFQDLRVGDESVPLYEYVCARVAEEWNEGRNCGVTAGANGPAKLARIRDVIGDMPILLLGIGAQGGALEECLRVGAGDTTFGLIPNVSRSILYASAGSDFAAAARSTAEDLNARLSVWREYRLGRKANWSSSE